MSSLESIRFYHDIRLELETLPLKSMLLADYTNYMIYDWLKKSFLMSSWIFSNTHNCIYH